MSNLKPGVLSVMQCSATAGTSCDRSGPGHVLRPMQERVSAATPSKWRDGVVTSVIHGWIAVTLVTSEETLWSWSHEIPAGLTIGQPVSLHALYPTLAFGRERLSVLVATTE